MDLTTTYLGLTLKNPFVPSASPLSRKVDTLKRLEDAGAAAVVLYSLFEEEITLEGRMMDAYLTRGTESYPEALSYFPKSGDYRTGPEAYLEHVRRVTQALSIPVIASLNGVSTGGWVKYAREMQRAGADALELNMYYLPTDPELSGAEVEISYVELLRDVINTVNIPVAVKLSPYFTALPHMARRLVRAGARGLVLFNRFYQPDFDIEALEVYPHLLLSDSDDLRLPLRWIAILYGRIDADLALTSGVHTSEDALKGLLAGAKAVMLASALLHHGPERLGEILREVDEWLEEHEYDSLAQLRGSMSQRSVAEPAAFERANYMKVLQSYEPG